MDSVMPLFTILGMDHSKYDGLLSRFTSGDTSVILGNLPTLELLMMGEYRCKAALGITPDPTPSANCATQCTPDTQAGNSQNDCWEIPPPPPQDDATFPSIKGVRWPIINGLYKDKKSSPHYHSRDTFHWKTGCPVLAELNLVYVKDDTKAQAIITKYTPHIDSLGRVPGVLVVVAVVALIPQVGVQLPPSVIF